MQANKPKGILYSALSLLLIAGIIACLVAFVNSFTAPIIASHGEEALRQNIEIIFEGNSGYEDITADAGDIEGVKALYRVKSATGGEDSYCVHSVAGGYGGDVEMLVGFNCDGEIVGVSVLAADGETPGVGQKIKEQAFLNGFTGLMYNAEGSAVDGVSGATVSSGAALKAVNSACKAIDALFNPKSGQSGSEEVAE